MKIPVALREISRCIDRGNDDHAFDDKRDVAAVVIAIMIMRLYICLHSSLSRDGKEEEGKEEEGKELADPLIEIWIVKNNKRKQVLIRS